MAEYKGPTWSDDSFPALNADNLNPLTRAVEDHGDRLAAVESAPPSGVSAGEVRSMLSGKVNVDGIGRRLTFAKPNPVGIIVGSSTLIGAGIGGSNAYRLRFTTAFETMLRNTYAPELKGRKPITLRAGDVTPAITTTAAGNSGGLGHASKTITPDTPFTFRSEWPTTGLWFGFREGEGTGEVRVSINGAPATSVGASTSGTARYTGQFKTPELPRGMHEYTITCTGETSLDFMHAYDGDNTRGPVLLNGGWGGSRLGWHLPESNTALKERLESVQPDFVILMFGANEEGGGNSRSEVANWVEGFNSMVADAVDVPPWVLYASQSRAAHNPDFDRTIITDPMVGSVAADPYMRSVMLDGEFFWPETLGESQRLGFVHSDNVHPNATGHAALAEMMGSALDLSPRNTGVPAGVMDGADTSPDEYPLEAVETPPESSVWTSDDFTGEDGALLSAGRSTSAALGGESVAWDVGLARGWKIKADSLSQDDGDTSQSSLFVRPPESDRQEITWTYLGGEATKGSWVRLRVPGTNTTSPTEQVGAKMISNANGTVTLTLEDRTAGSTSTLGGFTANVGDTITLRTIGDTAYMLVNGAQVATGAIRTAVPGFVQVLAFNGGVTIDNIIIGNI